MICMVFFCDFVRANVDKIFQHHGSHMGNVHLTISGIDVTIHLWEYWRWFISLLLGLPHQQFLLEDYELILVSNVGQKILELHEGLKRNIISTCKGFSITTLDDTGGVASTQLSVHDFHGLIFMIINGGFYKWGYPQMDGLVEKPIKMDDKWL